MGRRACARPTRRSALPPRQLRPVRARGRPSPVLALLADASWRLWHGGVMDEDEVPKPLNPITRAALALHRRPGTYAVLLGAGISKPTGVPTAWEILEALIREVAASELQHIDEPATWWKERCGANPSYSEVLEAVGRTKEERRAVLARFFERSDDDVVNGAKLPSEAHQELARLARQGRVRVIVTLNFDHLMEQALRDEGVAPVVIAGSSAIDEMEPLHAQRCVVIHLHGEYQSPELLNTPGELAAYGDSADRLVRQIADEYGLVIVGWSAEWDTKLVELLTPASGPRRTTWWIEPGDLNPTQVRLVSARAAEMIELTADDAMSRLAVAIDAVAAEAARQTPLEIGAGVATIKRELRSGGLALRSHDLVRQALGDIEESAIIHPDSYEMKPNGRTGESATAEVLDEVRATAAYVATLAYWGNSKSDHWWFDDLERLGWRPHVSGSSALIGLARSPALVLAYAAGAAAVAAQRWDLVLRLLTEPTLEDATGSRRGTLVAILNAEECGIAGASRRLCAFVAGVLHRHVGLGVGAAVDAWERFEYLCALTAMTGQFLPWWPCMRAEGIGRSENKATPAVWLDGHLEVIQPFLSAPGWFNGADVTTRRSDFDAAFAEYVHREDGRLLGPGGGFLPSGRHYPGRFDDRPQLDS